MTPRVARSVKFAAALDREADIPERLLIFAITVLKTLTVFAVAVAVAVAAAAAS